MGLLGDLVDDLLDIPAKIVRAPFKIAEEAACVVTGGHEWSAWILRSDGSFVRTCGSCAAVERRS